MKALLLFAAVTAAVGCSTEPPALRVERHQSAGGGSEGTRGLVVSRSDADHSAAPSSPPADPSTTTTEAATTTTAPTTTTTEPEPVTTTAAPVRVTPTTVRAVPTTEPSSPQSRTVRSGATPPEYIKQCESGGDYTAVNASSGAGGAWQFLPSTWRAMGGTGLPQNASAAEQDYRASLLWDGGRGAGQWACA